MVTLRDPHPPKRPRSISASGWITAHPSNVITVGTVAARVQAWNDVISKSPRSPHGPSPPSKKHIETRDGSDRGVRSSFGRRAEGSFGKPAARTDRLAPEGIKNDGLPPVGDPHGASEDLFGLHSGGADIKEHRLGGMIKEMTFYERGADRRALGQNLDSVDGFEHWGCVAHDKQREGSESRRANNRNSLGVALSADYNVSHTNNSSPKSVIDELGEMIDEALAHHRKHSAVDCTAAEQIQRALAKHTCRSSRHNFHTGETANPRKRRPLKEDWHHRALDDPELTSENRPHSYETVESRNRGLQGEHRQQTSEEERDRSSRHQSRETTNKLKQQSLTEPWQPQSQEKQDCSPRDQFNECEVSHQRKDRSQKDTWQHSSSEQDHVSPKHGSQSCQPMDPREQPSLSDEPQERTQPRHVDAGKKRRSADQFSAQTPLIARMAAEELAMSEPSVPLDEGMVQAATGSSSSSAPSRDQTNGQAFVRRASKRRRSSAMFRKAPTTHDYPMSDLQLQNPRRLTIDSAASGNHHEGEEVGPGDTLTTVSSPGLMSTVSTTRASNDENPSRRHFAAFLSSAANNQPTTRPSESDFAAWNRGRDQSTQDAEPTTLEESTPRGERRMSFTKPGLRQHTLSDIAGSEDQGHLTTGIPASTVTETPASTHGESPKPSESSATSPKTQSPMVWPFRWRLPHVALFNIGEPGNRGRSQESAVDNQECADSTTWRSRRTSSGSNEDRPSLSSDVVPDNDHTDFGRALKHSQSDPRLSQSDIGVLSNGPIDGRAGQEEQPTLLTQSRTASMTPKKRLSRSRAVKRRPRRVRNLSLGDETSAHQGEDERIHIFSRRPSETTRYTEGTRGTTYSADDEGTAPVLVSSDDENTIPNRISTIEENATPIHVSTHERATPVGVSVKDESTCADFPVPKEDLSSLVLSLSQNNINEPGPASPKVEGDAATPVATKNESTSAYPASPKEDVSISALSLPQHDFNSPGPVTPTNEGAPTVPSPTENESDTQIPCSPEVENNDPVLASTAEASITPLESPNSETDSKRSSLAISRPSSGVTFKSEVTAEIPSEVSRLRASRSNVAISEEGPRAERMPEVAALERSPRRPIHHHRTLCRCNDGEHSAPTIGSSRTFRTNGGGSIRSITIKVEIRTKKGLSETAEERGENTLVVKAKIGKREVEQREVSTESGSV